MRIKTKLFIFIFLLFVTIAYSIAVLRYDVSPIGPLGTKVGFSTINARIHDLFGVNMFWYKLTDIIGYFSILCGCGFAVTGLVQLIQRKSLFKVDGTIWCLGGLYVILGLLYAMFEVAIINYRPIIMEGEISPEASFPSSHTMLIIVIMCSIIMCVGEYISIKPLVSTIQVAAVLVIILSVVGRLICGAHWFSDIVAGCLYSATLISAFTFALSLVKNK